MPDDSGNIIVGLIFLALIIGVIILAVWGIVLFVQYVIIPFWYIELTLLGTAIAVYSWERTHPITAAKPQTPNSRLLIGMDFTILLSAIALAFAPWSWTYNAYLSQGYTLVLLMACIFSAITRSKKWSILYAFSLAGGTLAGASLNPYGYGYMAHSIPFFNQPFTALFVGGLIYSIPCVIFAFVSGGLTTSARAAFYAQQEKRRIEAEKRRLEEERDEIESLISQTEVILENAERNASRLRNAEYLSAITITMTELEDFSHVFRAGQFSYADAKEQILLLKDRAVTFGNIPSDEDTDEKARADLLRDFGHRTKRHDG